MDEPLHGGSGEALAPELEITAELPVLPDGSPGGRRQAAEEDDTARLPAIAQPGSDQLERQLQEMGLNLRELESRLEHASGQLQASEREAAERDARIGRLTRELQDATLALASERQRRMVNDTGQARARGAEQRGERYLEELRRQEYRQQRQAGQLQESEQRLDARDAHVTALLAELEQTRQANAVRERELDAERQRLQQQLQAMRNAEQALVQQQRASEASAQRLVDQHATAHKETGEHLAITVRELEVLRLRNDELEGESAAHVEMVRALHEQLAKARAEREESAARLREREARLEAAAADNAQLIGNLQHRVERLDHDGMQTTIVTLPSRDDSQDGPHEPVLLGLAGAPAGARQLGAKTTIGRTPDNDLCIDEDFISRHHAVMLATSTGMVLQDLDSTNGVFVNGERINRATLRNGDRVTIGKADFRFLLKPTRS